MKNFRYSIQIDAGVEDVFNALTNPFIIKIWSDEPAVMEAKAGSEFSLFDGEILGINLEVDINKKIVQKWYFEGQESDSIVTITLKPKQNKTELNVEHIQIPEEAYENISEGWIEAYLKPIKQLLEID